MGFTQCSHRDVPAYQLSYSWCLAYVISPPAALCHVQFLSWVQLVSLYRNQCLVKVSKYTRHLCISWKPWHQIYISSTTYFIFSPEGKCINNANMVKNPIHWRPTVRKKSFWVVIEFPPCLRNDCIFLCIITNQVTNTPLSTWHSASILHTMTMIIWTVVNGLRR